LAEVSNMDSIEKDAVVKISVAVTVVLFLKQIISNFWLGFARFGAGTRPPEDQKLGENSTHFQWLHHLLPDLELTAPCTAVLHVDNVH
jgi:hypothetical protein